MPAVRVLFWPILLFILLFISTSTAMVEEECFLPGNLMNIYAVAAALGCEYGEKDLKCEVASLAGASQTFASSSPCRGFIHFDSVFFMAQAVGFTGEMAYWISAYSQATDFVQYIPVDSCGNPLQQRYWTPPMRGFLRTSTYSGQHIRHLGVLYRGNGIATTATASGLSPNLDNILQEGMLVTARDWAFNNTNMYCTLGMTEPTYGNYFNGTACLSNTFLDNTTPAIVKGPIPAPAVNTTFFAQGQLLHYDCIGDPTCSTPPFNVTNVWFASQLAEYIQQQSNFSRLSNGQPVPEIIARFGVYLHQLADRTSHYYCSDSLKTAVLGPRSSDGAFYLSWDDIQCNFDYHSIQHYWEQGQQPVIAPQTWSALNLFYDELTTFAQKFNTTQPSWFTVNGTRLTKQQLVGDENNPGLLANLVKLDDVVQRVVYFMRNITFYGYSQVPGQQEPCSTWNGLCPTSASSN